MSDTIESAPTSTDVDMARVEACMARLSARLGDALRTDDYQRALYSTDASIYQIQPAWGWSCLVIGTTCRPLWKQLPNTECRSRHVLLEVV